MIFFSLFQLVIPAANMNKYKQFIKEQNSKRSSALLTQMMPIHMNKKSPCADSVNPVPVNPVPVNPVPVNPATNKTDAYSFSIIDLTGEDDVSKKRPFDQIMDSDLNNSKKVDHIYHH